MTEDRATDGGARRPSRSRDRVGALAAGLLAVALAVAGCSNSSGGSGVASVGSSKGASTSAAVPKASALAYSQCMRKHGVADFPDPDSDGHIMIKAGPGSDLAPDNPTFKAADAACKALRPAGQAPAGAKAANLKYAKCMRDNGIKDFPDPQPDGGIRIQMQPGSDLDPNNPLFKKADAACKQFQPGGGTGSGLSLNSQGAGA